MMKEITDRYKLLEIQQRIPLLIPDPNARQEVRRATLVVLSDTERWYHVEVNCSCWCFHGVFDYNRGMIYLDTASLLTLVNQQIQANLDAFNAGHHWRYKGL